MGKPEKTAGLFSINPKVLLREILCLLSGSFIAAFAVNVFFIPVKLTMGGLSGVASIIFQLTGQGRFLPFGVLFLLLNIPVMFMGWRLIGLRFIWRSLIGAFIYSIMLDLSASTFLDWFTIYINRPLEGGTPDPLIYSLFGGVLYGVGLGLVFRGGFTTGGTDIIAAIIKRRRKTLSMGQFIMIIDAVIVLSSVAAYRDDGSPAILLGMYSFIAMYLTAKSIDVLLEGFDFIRAAYIISDQSQAIAARIMNDLQRGVTSLKGKGMYTGQERDILLCVLSKKQIPECKAIVSEIDPGAFVIVVEAREVLGEGFGNAPEI